MKILKPSKEIEYCCFCNEEITKQSYIVNLEVVTINSVNIKVCKDCANKLSELIRTGGLTNILQEYII